MTPRDEWPREAQLDVTAQWLTAMLRFIRRLPQYDVILPADVTVARMGVDVQANMLNLTLTSPSLPDEYMVAPGCVPRRFDPVWT